MKVSTEANTKRADGVKAPRSIYTKTVTKMATLKIKITENQFFHYNNTHCIKNSDLAQMVGYEAPLMTNSLCY